MLVRKLYPSELQQHLRSEINSELGDELALKLVELGDDISFPSHDPKADLPAVYIQLVDWDPKPGPPLGACEVDYLFSIAYFRALEPGESPQENLTDPTRTLSEFFLRDACDLPLFSAAGCEVLSAFPSKAEFGELGKFEFGKVSVTIEGSAFGLLVRTRSVPIPI